MEQFLAINLDAAYAAEALRRKGVNVLPSHTLTLTLNDAAACVAWANGAITDAALRARHPNVWALIQREGESSPS